MFIFTAFYHGLESLKHINNFTRLEPLDSNILVYYHTFSRLQQTTDMFWYTSLLIHLMSDHSEETVYNLTIWVFRSRKLWKMWLRQNGQRVIKITRFEDGGKGTKSRCRRQYVGSHINWKGQGNWLSPYNLQKGTQALPWQPSERTDTLTLANWDLYQNSSLKNCKIINLSFFFGTLLEEQ